MLGRPSVFLSVEFKGFKKKKKKKGLHLNKSFATYIWPHGGRANKPNVGLESYLGKIKPFSL